MDITENTKINATKTFKLIMLDKDLKQYEVGLKLGIKDRQSFNRILQKNDNMRLNEISKISDSLNCDVKLSLIDRDTGKEWVCDFL